jgi:hypothetical protein
MSVVRCLRLLVRTSDVTLLEREPRFVGNDVMELAFEQLLPRWRPCAKGHSEELVRASSLHVLFVKKVKQ